MGTVIAAYATRSDRPDLPFWAMSFANVTVRLLGSDDFPMDAKRRAAADLTALADAGLADPAVADPVPLVQTALAHERVDNGTRERVIVAVAE